ncbi:hypothetical protein [Janthinobacterium fluminis]|uniref:Ferritin-like domain-containing protein n=1 Tax=Janthinobacterium fluminis TaxID=2987524 RepID=A0ABT5JY33_9BURK|nr:hypothetical protein [Janthinobacterium fluminis]MDC8757090.1 hypothetical protein [Janthinobacterium fluminis]
MPADAAPASLQVPPLRGWPRLQAQLVHHIKRAALRQLHASAAGERLLLRMYLIGEEATEIALQRELIGERPDWLARQMDQHLADEQRHARAFAAALAERGARGAADEPDWLSRRKIAQWRRLAAHHAERFAAGLLVPAFAIGLCAEQMATRVLQRHCELIGPHHPLHPLLSGVLADEDRHVRLCSHTLARLVAPQEQPALAALLREIRGIDRAYGVSGAIGMYLAGAALRLRPAHA